MAGHAQRFVKSFSLIREGMEKFVNHIGLEAPTGCSVRLLLTDDRGARWTVTMSPGTERFIGRYARLDDFDAGNQFLRYQVR
jgi:hypothetical protein